MVLQTEHLIFPHEAALLKDVECSNPYIRKEIIGTTESFLLVQYMHKEKQ